MHLADCFSDLHLRVGYLYLYRNKFLIKKLRYNTRRRRMRRMMRMMRRRRRRRKRRRRSTRRRSRVEEEVL
jgi:hypothetical protein